MERRVFIAGAAATTAMVAAPVVVAARSRDLDEAGEVGTLLRLQGIMLRHPLDGPFREGPAASSLTPGTESIGRRLAELSDASRQQVRIGSAWFARHVDLRESRRFPASFVSAWDRASEVQRKAALAASSLALAAGLPGLTGADDAVATLWLRGLTGAAIEGER